jgi:hypothetical protein
MAPSRVDPNRKQAKTSIDQVEEDPFCIDRIARTVLAPSQSTVLKKNARGYLPSLPIFYVFAERGEYIKDTFGQARHRKFARRAGHTLRTPCSLVSRSHG